MPADPPTVENTAALSDRRIAFVGKLGGVNRKEAREIVRRLGGTMVEKIEPSVDTIVVGADVLAFEEPIQLLENWVTEAVAKNEISVISETEFWQLTGVVEPEMDVSQLYTPAMLAGILEVPISTIRRWHRRGLITPVRQVKKLPYFDFQEVASARRIANMIAAGTHPGTIETKLSQLAELYPNLQRPLSQLSISFEGSRLLLRQGESVMEPTGQMRIDFDSTQIPADDVPDQATLSLHVADAAEDFHHAPTTREEFIRYAIHLEDEGATHEAIDVYRSMSMAFGASPDVCFRIAELLYQLNDLRGARERYFMAVELEDSFVEARANLGCVLVELEQLELAKSAFEGALQHHADYPDAHFHLARLLDDMHLPNRAKHHWSRFLELTPQSPWAAEARHRLDNSDDPSDLSHS